MKMLRSVSELSPEPFVQELEAIGYGLSVMNMMQVYLLAESHMGTGGQTITLDVTGENYLEISRIYFALAVINLAQMIFDSFSVPGFVEGMRVEIKRTDSIEKHEEVAFYYLDQVSRLFKKYGAPPHLAGS